MYLCGETLNKMYLINTNSTALTLTYITNKEADLNISSPNLLLSSSSTTSRELTCSG